MKIGKKQYAIAVILIIIVPLFLSVIFTNALYKPTEKYRSTFAAFVNDDKPVKIDGELVPLGRQFGAVLLSNSDNNYTWEFNNKNDALNGLKSGKYATVVIIPKNFSKNLTSVSKNLDKAKQANIEVYNSPTAKIQDDSISQELINTARTAFNKEISDKFIDTIFISFTKFSQKIKDAAEGSIELQKNGELLDNGAVKIADGSEKLSNATAQFSNGINKLSKGASALYLGSKKLTKNSNDLANGVNKINDAAKLLNSGASKLPDSDQVFDAIKILNEIATFANQLITYNSGLIENLINQYNTDGCNSNPQTPLCQSQAKIISMLGCLVYGGDSYFGINCAIPSFNGLDYYDALLSKYSVEMSDLLNGLPKLKSGISQLTNGIFELNKNIQLFNTGISRSNKGIKKLSNSTKKLQNGAKEINLGVKELANNEKLYSDKLGEYISGVGKLASGLSLASKQFPNFTDDEKLQVEKIISAPISKPIDNGFNPVKNIAFITTLILWLCTSLLFMLRFSVPKNILSSSKSHYRLHFRNIIPSTIGSIGQSIAVAVGINIFIKLPFLKFLELCLLLSLIGIVFFLFIQFMIIVFKNIGYLFCVALAGMLIAIGLISTVNKTVISIFNATPLSVADLTIRKFLIGFGSIAPSIIMLIVFGLICYFISDLFIRSIRYQSKK